MSEGLPQLKIERKTGNEHFRQNGQDIELKLIDFWQWYASDLIDNTKRGILAEFIVATALGCLGNVCNVGEAYDLELPTGEKIEVKSAAYLQTWFQKKHSAISFTIGLRRKWESSTGEMADEIRRQADIYVFCLLKHKHKDTVNPLDLDQWVFYILPASVLNTACPIQERIGLESLLRLKPYEASYSEIKPYIEKFIQSRKATASA